MNKSKQWIAASMLAIFSAFSTSSSAGGFWDVNNDGAYLQWVLKTFHDITKRKFNGSTPVQAERALARLYGCPYTLTEIWKNGQNYPDVPDQCRSFVEEATVFNQ